MPEITVAILDKFHPYIKTAIAAAAPANWTLLFIDESTLAARAAVLRDADMALVMAAPMPKELLAAARKLRFIQKLGAGVDHIDLDACRERGVGVARLHAGNSIPVAEHTVLLMLAVYRQLPQIDRRTRAGGWDKESARGEHRQLLNKTVGLVGLGAVGKEVAKHLRGFDVTIIYYDPVRPSAEVERSLGVSYAEFDDLVRRADIVSLHLPLLPETVGIISAERIRSMKKGAVLINCARGGVVDEAALVAALKEGHLFGAAIDTFASEPPVGSELLALENTVVTSHLAGATLDNFSGIVARAVENAKAFLRGVALPETDVVIAPSRVGAKVE
jgi:phosphoglycerate dehydrogenase-like enzyme